MTILRLDLKTGGWRAVPPRIFEDERLSLDTRGVAGYIATRSDTFSLSVSGLCRLLRIGDDKWRRINRELTNAGYLKRSMRKDSRGRFRHELLFSPIPYREEPNTVPKKQPRATPKIPDQPGTERPRSDQPDPVNPGSTRKPVNQISDHHHQNRSGTDEPPESPPSLWIRAADYEISIEELERPIRNRGALQKTIIERYRKNGGPDPYVITALLQKESAEEIQKTREILIQKNSKLVKERALITAQHHAEAEKKAQEINEQQRTNILNKVEQIAPIKASKLARLKFIEHGEIIGGALQYALIEYIRENYQREE